MKKAILISTLLLSSSAFTQGFVKGVLKDKTSNEAIAFEKVKVEGQNTGAVTDIDGSFTLKLNPGNYNIIFSALSFNDTLVKVTVQDKKTIDLTVNLSKEQNVKEFEGATVVAYKVVASSVAGDDARRRESANATDGMTREQMKATGDGDVAEVAQRVPGLSVEGGKHVYVRGLGDRYTKTILNGLEIPGLDPDRNSVQMDIFPTNLIDNVTVYKTFTPNLAGDFSGGLINIQTRDLPSKKMISFSSTFGFNSNATFNKDFLTHNGGKLDFIAINDGSRDLDFNPALKIPDPVINDPKLTNLTKSFNDEMSTTTKTAMLDQSYAFSMGDVKHKENFDYGYNLVLNYRLNNRFYNDLQFNEYLKDANNRVNDLDPFNKATGQMGETDILWSALIGQSLVYKKTNKFNLTLFHTQNGKTTTSYIRSQNLELNPSVLLKHSLQYNQRAITNVMLSGQHTKNKLKIDWKVAPTFSKISDPDIKSTILEEITDVNGNISYGFNQSVGAEIRRIYRDLSEKNVSAKADFTYELETKYGKKAPISFGVLNTFKQRSFAINDFVFGMENVTTFVNDPNYYFSDEMIWDVNRDSGTYVRGGSQLANTFDAIQIVLGTYVMQEYAASEKWNFIYGARVEKANNLYTGQNNTGTEKYNNTSVLNEINVLPSLNIVYKLKNETREKPTYTNLRLAYGSTVARPTFREISIAQIYDPIQGRRYNGNIDLKQTNIHNFDMRWEHFFGNTELISMSTFYKRFINPIEVISFDLAPNEVKPVNAGVADLFGGEFELRKDVPIFKADSKQNLTFGFNTTLVLSRIDMNKVMINKGDNYVSEKSLREENARDGEIIKDFRPMYGQSPYVINTFATYKNDNLGLVFNVSYNVQGKRLAVIGMGRVPDVYEVPFHSLNCKASKTLGKKELWNLSVAAQNILNSSKRRSYVSYLAQDMTYDVFNQGINVNATISYTIK